MEEAEDQAARTIPVARRPLETYQRLGRVRFRLISGPDAGQEAQVEVGRERLLRGGRNGLNDIVLHDDLVSGFHFSLEFTPAGIVLRDLSSTNGVFAGGVRVREALIDLEDVFRVGDTTLQITGTDKIIVPLAESEKFGEMYGWSPVMRELFVELERLASLPTQDLPVLITGETGTGKELVARGLHDRSARARGPFVVQDCTALPRELAEGSLLGYKRGSFTGATEDHAGVFEQAHGGTLFIDELGELPLELQAKLLRVLDRGEVCRLGEQHRPRKVDIRVISATNRDLRRMVAEGSFREDLYFRVLGKHVELPSLRERGDDVLLLADRFLQSTCARLGVPTKQFSVAAYAALRAERWPGNVRQLRRTVECTAQLTEAPLIEVRDLNLDTDNSNARPALHAAPLFLMPWEEARDEFQREYIKSLMQRVGTSRGWINRAAALAGMDRSGFVKALKRLGLYRTVMEIPGDS
jgi:DNA-binding NtrC family response regulator